MKPQLIKRSLIENLYRENNKKIFNSVNFQNNVFFNILIIFFLFFCFIFLIYRYSNNSSNKKNINSNNDEYYSKKKSLLGESYVDDLEKKLTEIIQKSFQ